MNLFTLLRFMHSECFEVWEDNILAYTSKLKDGGKRGKQQWSEKQKVRMPSVKSSQAGECHSQNNLLFSLKQGNLWKQPVYHLAVEVCGCCCGEVSFLLDFQTF